MSFDFNTFGSKVFNDKVLRAKLPEDTYKSLRSSIDIGLSLDPKIADIVAKAMKDWAIQQGATHYTHWFQPMTNITAGKHDSFICPQKDGTVILEFSGKELIKGEPDASSFPSGGLRNTFEARGYTAWDCTSPAFIKDGTLYIPTAFCSYTGEALDAKTPLLRSMEAISKQALRLIKTFGNHTSSRVDATVGAEQEYFLVDRQMYEDRLDLKICGRTLFGAMPPKGQEMDDHYFGRIRLRVSEFMHQLDNALWELGISSKTKHNEAAPAQHELAPIFETVNIACDHNQLTMEVMRIIAKKNGLACLLHEKPFEGVNGSGKHNNWSLSTDDGINLLEPGKTPYENVQFLIVLCAIIKAVDEHADLLRMSAAIAGNDYRLGANEAPPAIISIFLGEQLTSILENIASGDSPHISSSGILQTGVSTLPQLKKDDSDRNRTSPFAFTGNKFEFRMVGSSASIACANYVLNTIVAQSMEEFALRLEHSTNFDAEIKSIISDTMKNNGKIIFNGNNYTQSWVDEAKKRGLPNLSNTVDAAKAMIEPHNVEVLNRHHVLTEVECNSRYEIMLENYSKIVHIEAATMVQMAKRQIIPACISFAGDISASYNNMLTAGSDNTSIKELIKKLSALISKIFASCDTLSAACDSLVLIKDSYEQACNSRDVIKHKMDELRKQVDEIEVLVSSKYWPMPNYTDLLHRV
ncbi:MAG: glutamine synthetase III [Oscillospiraceae bacterium]